MNQRQKTVIRILLIIAEWLAPDDWKKEVHSLACHIQVDYRSEREQIQ